MLTDCGRVGTVWGGENGLGVNDAMTYDGIHLSGLLGLEEYGMLCNQRLTISVVLKKCYAFTS